MFRRLGIPRRFWQPAALVLAAVLTGSLTVFLKGCGGGTSSSPSTVGSPPRDPGSGSGSTSAILGLVVDPFAQLCPSGSTAALCSGGPLFSRGNKVELFNLSSRGDILLPALSTTALEGNLRFTIPFSGSITQPPGKLVSVQSNLLGQGRQSGQPTPLRGFIFSAAVDVSPWSEALYRILLRERDRVPFSNLAPPKLGIWRIFCLSAYLFPEQPETWRKSLRTLFDKRINLVLISSSLWRILFAFAMPQKAINRISPAASAFRCPYLLHRRTFRHLDPPHR
jgi:hypothetical protein